MQICKNYILSLSAVVLSTDFVFGTHKFAPWQLELNVILAVFWRLEFNVYSAEPSFGHPKCVTLKFTRLN